MDFVGKSLRKEFEGFGVFEGVIKSYDSSTGFFRVLYEDGDSEEIDFEEVSKLMADSSRLGRMSGRKPKRRRQNGPRDPGKIDCNSIVVSDANLHDNLVVEEPILCQNLENNAGVSINVDDCVAGNGKLNGGLDLNRGFEIDEIVENGGLVRGIDLNVRVENCDFDGNVVGFEKAVSLGGVSVEEGKKERGFDLNLGFDDEGVIGVSGSVDVEVGLGSSGELRNEIIPEVDLNNGVSNGNDGQFEGGGSESVTPIPCENGTGRRKRKRGKGENNLSSPAETVLRRSARRAKAALAEITASSAVVEDGVNDVSASRVCEELEEKRVAKELKKVVEPEVPPSKIDLPPSSANLDLDGIPVVDLFSVYSCLRSFSTLLYLSPFELEDFVLALKTRVSNLLIDCVHVSILQILRKHLEFLANEGCESASTCLRNLNWDLLDEITWPVFMVAYLLIHCSSLKSDFSLSQLNILVDGGYYKQSENVKIELLRCLCDDVVEVEAIRSELGKRKISSDGSGDFLLSDDVEEVADGNSDECCLCKMDGNLICCDGCPAAYHAKCVGIVSSLLPEGDWYCPECAISRHSFGSKPRKLSRGAEPLGIDPYGRLFFSCFDYLLVSDSFDTDSSFSYYHKNDLNTVIQLLESSNKTYGSILKAIFQNWAKDEVSIVRKSMSSIIGCPSHISIEASTPPDLFGLETSSEPDEAVLQANEVLQNSHRPLAKRISAAKRRKKHFPSIQSGSANSMENEDDEIQGLSGYIYDNSYKFGRTAALVVEELLRKPSDKVSVDTPKTEEEIISIQSKFITKKSTKFCWATIQELNEERQKEKCGWCYCCRFSVEHRDCLFNIKNNSSISETLKADIDGCLSKRNEKGHLVDIICYILCMEERLRGLLLGPWSSPQYSEHWRKRVLEAPDVCSLKHPLLMLESNIHPMALSSEWSKHIDSVATMGSASHFVSKSRAISKNGISKKKGTFADTVTKSSTAGKGLTMFWWRGGLTSRSLFNWKVIPRSIALKAARKGGAVKIPDVVYSDSPENTKRNKYVVWRAAVEASRSIEQLALQVRELDLFIRWDDIENTQPHFLLNKEAMKSIRLFKKVIIRRKSVEGTVVKYLLDFGKRRSIPEVVVKHGLKLEDSDSERKKYWLNESYVPLYLIKIFEERRIVRKAGKTKSSAIRNGDRKMKRLSEEKGFEYLFLRAARGDNYQCGRCNKNVPSSEAVSCQLCDGFFHKKHVMKFSEGSTSGCTYTCYTCRDGKQVKNDSSRGKKKFGKLLHTKKFKVGRKLISKASLSTDGKTLHQRMSLRNVKKVHNRDQRNGKILRSKNRLLAVKNTIVGADVTLRRSPRTAKCMALKPDVIVGTRKRKRNKSSNSPMKKTPKTSSCKKKRTHIFHTFWINGLQMSKKPKDERVINFKRKGLCVAFESSGGISDKPKCSLCLEQKFKPTLVYIACDVCEAWFHGEAVGLNRRNIKNVIGFKCHVCRERSPPICPFAGNSRDTVATSMEAVSEPQDDQILPEVEIQMGEDGLQENHISEDHQCLPDLTQQKFDEISNHDNAPLMDSKLEIEIQMGEDGLQENHISEDHQCLPDLTQQKFDEISNHDNAPLMDSKLEIEIQMGEDGLQENHISEDHQCLPDLTQQKFDEISNRDNALLMDSKLEIEIQMGEDGLQENHISEDHQCLPDLTQQKFDEISNHDNAPLMDSKLEIEIQMGEDGLQENHISEDHQCLPDLTQQKFDEISNHDNAPLMDSKLEIEIQMGEDGLQENHISEDHQCLPDLTQQKFDEISNRDNALLMDSKLEIEIQMGEDGLQENHISEDHQCLPDLTQQKFDEISNHDNAPLVDSKLEIENGSDSCTEVISNSIES